MPISRDRDGGLLQSRIVLVTAGDGLTNSNTASSPILDVNVDDSTIEISSDTLRVKSGGITATQLSDGITFSDGSSNTEIQIGQTVTFSGTTNEVTVSESGGTITIGLPNDVTIGGNLTVNGATTTVESTTVTVNDPLFKYAADNTSTDTVDIGFYGVFNDGTTQYTGLFRDATDGKFRLFTGLQTEPTSVVNTGGTGYTGATLVASLEGNASTASTWQTSRTLSLGGDLSGSVAIDGSSDVTLTATLAAGSITLGTDTTGDYVATITTSGNGINVTGSGESATYTLSLDSDLDTISQLTHSGGEVIYSNAGTWAAAAPGSTSGVQPYDAELAAIAGLTSAADRLPYFTGSGTAALATFTAFGRSLVDDADAATARATLGLTIGTDVQGYDAGLASIAGLTTSADKMIYTTASDTYAVTTLTSYIRGLLDDADAASARTTLGVDVAGTDNSTDVTLSGSYDYLTISEQTITLGQIDLTTDVTGVLPIANGGTNASTAAAARTNLGLAIGSDVQAYDAELAALAGLVSAANKLPYFTGSGTAALADLTSFARTILDDADAATVRTTLGLGIGTDIQAYDAELAALASTTSAANALPYFTGSGTATTTTLSSFGRSLIDDADAAAARTTLGVDAAGTDNSTPVTLSTDANSNLLSLSTQEIGLDTQTANYLFAGPTTGAATAPAFRAMVAADIPNDLIDSQHYAAGSIDHEHLAADVINGATAEASIAADDEILIYDTSATALRKMTRSNFVSGLAGSGDVVGPASSTDNAIARYDGTTGKIIQSSGVILDDDDAITANEFIGGLRGAVQFKARNESGVSINKGDAVYISGVSGSTQLVAKAQANNPSTMPAFGIAGETAATNNPITIIAFGVLTGLDTSNSTYYELNKPVYVSAATAGQLTKTPPTGESSLIQNIGFVTRVDASVGSIRVGGAGRSNATPNLDSGKIFLGNSSNRAVSVTPSGDSTISDTGAITSAATQNNITSIPNLATVGTIGTGTWEGTTIGVAYGGTGATSLDNLITLGTHTTGNYLATLANATNGGTTISNSGSESAAATIALNLNDLSAGAIADGDSIAFIDSDGGNATKKEAVHDLATLFAGTGLTATSSVLAVDASQTQITELGTITTGVWNATAIDNAYLSNSSITITDGVTGSAISLGGTATFSATANETTVSQSGGTVTIGLVSDPIVDGLTAGNVQVGVTGDNEIDTSSGNLTLDSAGGTVTVDDNLTVAGNLTVNGTTTTVNSTVTTLDDPILTLGGDTAPASDDNKDRGIEFRWHNGTSAKVGFFGFDDSSGRLTFIPDATNTSEVFSGTVGDVEFTNIYGTLQTASQTNITGVGTITTGTWEATDVGVAHGGTGASTAADARTNLGVAIGSDVQAYDAELAAIAGLTSAADKLPYFTGSGTAAVADFSSFGRSLVDDATASDARTTLGVAIGSDVQAYDAELAAIAALATTDGNIIVGNGSTWVAESGATARTSLGVDPAGTDNSTDVTLVTTSHDYLSITGQAITLAAIDLTTDVTGDLPVAEGGTGSSTASGARTNLGLGTAAVADTGISNTNVPVFTSGVADGDFLKVNGTSVEGRSASEVVSDIGASTAGFSIAMAVAL